MKKFILNGIIVMLTAAMCLTSCSSDDPIPVIPTSMVTLEIPANLENAVLSNAVAKLTNVQTNQVTTVEGAAFLKDGNGYKIMCNDLEAGTYNIVVTGHLDFTLNGVAGQKDFEVTSDNVVLSETSHDLKMVVSTFTAQGGFVISEIFFTGTMSPEGRTYSGDQYIIITNNSDVTLYADSIGGQRGSIRKNASMGSMGYTVGSAIIEYRDPVPYRDRCIWSSRRNRFI